MQAQRKELNFEGQSIFVGIDVHLKSWNVSIFTENLHHKTFNQPPKAEVLLDYLKSNFPNASYLSAYEAGFCGFWVHYKLKELGINNIVVNPADVPTTQKEKMRKSDPIDSSKLGRSLRSNELSEIYIPRPETLEERSLVRIRSVIVTDMVRIKQRIKSMLYFYGIEYPIEFQNSNTHWSKKFLNWLKEIELRYPTRTAALGLLINEAELQRKLLLEATTKIRVLSKTEYYSKNMELITSVPGIGLITGMDFLTEIEDINRFENSDKLAGLVGIVPNCSKSGEIEKDGEMTSRGHSLLRKGLIESSWVAVRIDPALSFAYYNYCKRMEPNKAIVRIARKLLNRIYSVLKHQKKYVTGIV
ncbi:MAG: IS110 family transposase [Paludibacter sp.]|nr:IS110 family transposase [Paludibacter sp.]